MKRFTDTEIWAIANALRLAADTYKSFAIETPELAQAFNDQRTVALSLADTLEGLDALEGK